jgi:hypothetical protein
VDFDWKDLDTIVMMFEEFYEATNIVSTCKTTTLSSVIPIFNILIDAMEEHSDNASEGKIASQFGLAADAAKEKLLQYYNRTDASPFYVAALILDPRNKLGYFQRESWAKALINTFKKKYVFFKYLLHLFL